MAKKIPAQAFYEEYHGHRVEHLRHLVTLSSVSAPASVDFRGETVSLKMGRPSQLHLRKVHESTVLFLKQFSKIGAFNLGVLFKHVLVAELRNGLRAKNPRRSFVYLAGDMDMLVTTSQWK